MSLAEVKLWGSTIGAVSWDAERELAFFEYAEQFVRSAIRVAPLTMPLAETIYSFPALARASFHGLPGLLSDSLPDRFGNALIDAWLVREGRTPESFDPVERLCYVGTRGMGALEFEPARGPRPRVSRELDIAALVELAGDILTQRESLNASFEGSAREEAMKEIFRVGTSAGGARAKAIIAWNPATHEVRSGQVDAGSGFQYWLLKFDGVSGNKDKELEDPEGYGQIEYAYFCMARDAGIDMEECRLLAEGPRKHFMTKRFDRTGTGQKLHMLSLGAMAHLDFNQAGAHSYEQAFETMRQLGLPMRDLEQQFLRMTFNIVARNQDDHVKNIAYLMNKAGEWRLSPAFDLTYSYNPTGAWMSRHQLSLNGKRDGFTLEDFSACEQRFSMRRGLGSDALDRVRAVVSAWPGYAAGAGVPEETARRIAASHRLQLPLH